MDMGGLVQVMQAIIFLALSFFFLGYQLIGITGSKVSGIRMVSMSVLISLCISIIIGFLLALFRIFNEGSFLLSIILISIGLFGFQLIKNDKTLSKRGIAGSKRRARHR